MILKKGSQGVYVRQLQARLGLTVDGDFGPKTEWAVLKWQNLNGLKPDGIVGALTWGRLFNAGPYAGSGSGDIDDDGEQDTWIAPWKPRLRETVPEIVVDQLSACIAQFMLDSRLRLAHFLAQCHHESAGFRFTAENLNYSASGLRKVFGKYFPGDLAGRYAGQPEKIAARVYANRLGNGDEASGEGWTYRGRGYIQLTGKANYTDFDHYIADDILAEPDLVARKYPLLSAAWFWHSRSLNAIADRGGDAATVAAVTAKVNGGDNGLAERIKLFQHYYGLLE